MRDFLIGFSLSCTMIKLLLSPQASGFKFCMKNAATRPQLSKSFLQMSNDLSAEAASYFLVEKDLKFSPTSGGVNNVVQYVETSDRKQYVLRIYNNGLNTPRVKYEHEVLGQLRKKSLSFKIPTTIASIKTGQSSVSLSNGAEASLFELIPGELPKLTRVQQIGQASGELSSALEDVVVNQECPTPPYYELYKVHHAVTRDLFFKEVASPTFDSCREPTDKIIAAILDVEKKIASFEALKLPKQLIHGDLHYDNILCDGDKVSGLLDFEFCSIDWRAMEVAICLSKYAGEKDAMRYFDSFITGFAEKGILTAQEIEVVPDLINLRVLSNVVYFVGRALSKEDTIDALTTRAATYASRVKWIADNSQAIRDLLTSKMKKV
jgi:homoserine kinase type II